MVRSISGTGCYLALALCLPCSSLGNEEENAERARQFLETYCHRCHGAAAEGGFNFALHRDKLVSANKVVPGNPDDSELLIRVVEGEMPPPGETPRPNQDQINGLKTWIQAGAPDFHAPGRRDFISNDDVAEFILHDLRQRTEKQQEQTRYFTITNLYNAQFSDDEMQTYRIALAKLINSLSWNARLVAPQPIDPAATIMRIDLRELKWAGQVWEEIVKASPYDVTISTKQAIAFRELSATTTPLVRGDWFVFAASRPPLYHAVLQLPKTIQQLERRLGVDAERNISEQLVARAGFVNSGVSQNNRIIERHDSSFGAYWKSYDFANSVDDRNAIQFPLGPARRARTSLRHPSRSYDAFQHDGGEMIFNLPNGMQAYFLANADGQRIDAGPVTIVSDPKQPDRTVRNGISCMSCHYEGIIMKEDDLRPTVLENRSAYRAADEILALYPDADIMKQLMEADRRRFGHANSDPRIGVTRQTDTGEPVFNMARRFDSDVDLAMASAEAGLTPKDFQERLRKITHDQRELAKTLGPLLIKGGLVKRAVFEQQFENLIDTLEELGPIVPSETTMESLSAQLTVKHFAAAGEGSLRAITFEPGGGMLASAGSDGLVKLWNVSSGQLLQTLSFVTEGGDVQSLAFRSDGKFLAVALRAHIQLIDAGTWQALPLPHQPSKIFTSFTSIAFSPDDRRLAFAGAQRAAEVWDLSGKSLPVVLEANVDERNRRRPPRQVAAVAFASVGDALIGASGPDLKVWDASEGVERRTLRGHMGTVTALASSPDGKRLASADEKGTIFLWDAATGRKEFALYAPDGRAVRALSFSPDGNMLASALDKGKLTLWSVFTGKERLTMTAHSVVKPVVDSKFSPDGEILASACEDGEIRCWKLPK
jgi:mono/diheme cytochrome c family protein